MRAGLPFSVAAALGLLAMPASSEGRYIFDVVKQPPFGAAWNRLVEPLKKSQPWMIDARGVAGPSVTINVDGQSFEVFSLCKPHDCADNQMQVLFSDGGRKAHGAFRTRDGVRMLGHVSATQGKALLQAFD